MLEPGKKTFLIQIGDKADSVSVDRLKPHIGKESVQLAIPGRPRTKQDIPVVAPSSTYVEAVSAL